VTMGGLALATIALLAFRSKVLGKDGGADQAGMLDKLRAMRDRGEMTPEEFDAAKSAMIAKLAPGRGGLAEPVRAAPPKKSSATHGLVAKPGFDLTGRPLPRPPDEGAAR
jgi:hypothetical protein